VSFGQCQCVALRFAGALHDAFKLGEVSIHRSQRFVRLETEVDHAARLRRGDPDRVGGRHRSVRPRRKSPPGR
jgi:hypothetical protein